MSIEQGFYVLFTKLGNSLCLGTDDDGNCLLKPFDETDGNIAWAVQAMAGSSFYYLVNRRSMNSVRFSHLPFSEGQLIAHAINPLHPGFGLSLKDKGNGWVSIQNFFNMLAMDVYEGVYRPGQAVWAYAENGGDNQQWRMVPASAL